MPPCQPTEGSATPFNLCNYAGMELQIVFTVAFETTDTCQNTYSLYFLDDTSANGASGVDVNAHTTLHKVANNGFDDRRAAQTQAGHLAGATNITRVASISSASSPSSSVARSITVTAATPSSSRSPTNDEIDDCDSLTATTTTTTTDRSSAKQSFARSASVEDQGSMASLSSVGDRPQSNDGVVPQLFRDINFQSNRGLLPVTSASSANDNVEHGQHSVVRSPTNGANQRPDVGEQNKHSLRPVASVGLPDGRGSGPVLYKKSSGSVDCLSAEVTRESQRRASEFQDRDGRRQVANRETTLGIHTSLTASSSMKSSSHVAHARKADGAAGIQPVSAAELQSARRQLSAGAVSSRRKDESSSIDGSYSSEDAEGRRMVKVSRNSAVGEMNRVIVTSSHDVTSSSPLVRVEYDESQQLAVGRKKSATSSGSTDSGIKSAGRTRFPPVDREANATDVVNNFEDHPRRRYPERTAVGQFDETDSVDESRRSSFGISREQALMVDRTNDNYSVNLILPASSLPVRSPPSSVLSSSFSPTSSTAVMPQPPPFTSTVHHTTHSDWKPADNTGDMKAEIATPTRSGVAPPTPTGARCVATVRVGGRGDDVTDQPT
jgi:hypothetical protein